MGVKNMGFQLIAIPFYCFVKDWPTTTEIFKLLEFSFKHKTHKPSCLKQSSLNSASGNTAEMGNLHNTEKRKHGELKGE